MPAGDGAVRRLENPRCQFCGARLAGTVTHDVDDWTVAVCRACGEAHALDVPVTCHLWTLPRAEAPEAAVDVDVLEAESEAPR